MLCYVMLDAEKNYTTTQQEAAVMMWAIKQFREPYLQYGRFKLITDHKALEKLLSIKSGTNRLLERWAL